MFFRSDLLLKKFFSLDQRFKLHNFFVVKILVITFHSHDTAFINILVEQLRWITLRVVLMFVYISIIVSTLKLFRPFKPVVLSHLSIIPVIISSQTSHRQQLFSHLFSRKFTLYFLPHKRMGFIHYVSQCIRWFSD